MIAVGVSFYSRYLAYWVVELLKYRLQQYRIDNFRYFLGVRVRLIKVSFIKVNKENKIGDFGYCSLLGCPLNIGFTALKDWSHGKQLILFPSNRIPGKKFIVSLGISH